MLDTVHLNPPLIIQEIEKQGISLTSFLPICLQENINF